MRDREDYSEEFSRKEEFNESLQNYGRGLVRHIKNADYLGQNSY